MFWPFIEIDGRLAYCPLAEFGTRNLREGKDIYAKVVLAQPLTAHVRLHNALQAVDRIVVVERGRCDFMTKVLIAQAAGAVAVIVANTNRDDPHEAFVMDAGRRSDTEISSVRIPAVMISHTQATTIFEQLRESYLDRRDYALTIKFLGAHTAAFVMEQLEIADKKHRQDEEENQAQVAREHQQKEAAETLRKRLATINDKNPVVSTEVSTASSASAGSSAPVPRRNRKPSDRVSEEHFDTLSIASSVGPCDNNHRVLSPRLSHWCPMTSAVLVVDVQNYFVLEDNEKCVSSHSPVDVDFYKRLKMAVIPNIQDILLACRACDGLEILYTVVESATKDGRDCSRAHKHAGIHIPKNGFGAKIFSRVAATDDDIVIPRTGINIFECTNIDYILRNLGISHLIVLGISTLNTVQIIAQTALDRGYQVSLIRDAITAERLSLHDELFVHCERLGGRIRDARGFVRELQGFLCESDGSYDHDSSLFDSLP